MINKAWLPNERYADETVSQYTGAQYDIVINVKFLEKETMITLQYTV